ncbi:metal-dependent hydrolase [Desulfovibrio litoralis]|uniref:Membrane-bound metal-dependent hydrolase YbcI, DUF457 family n=1 Tax=Desulfovibrio litoralis DSM 11393 TaxID=1121455 RepID=A0A1M7TNA2_9BACT|nr:metal-dependent hydrolase [Desulfovibrio litoralis]SHN72160.1 Membrane-bound metal-dependent hydrolase YbcI, DUF457 family [Desulfovibrio litoralis DSM 11393]
MDSVTHLATGMIMGFARPFLPKKTSLAISLPLGLIVTHFPDIDIIFSHGLYGMLALHRGITHSLIFIFAMAVLFSLITYYLSYKQHPRPTRLNLFAFSLLGLLIHIMLDCFTAFGTQIFLPWSNFRFSLPIVYIIDLWWTIPLLTISIYCILHFMSLRMVVFFTLAYTVILSSIVYWFTPTPLEEIYLVFPIPVLIFWVLFLPLAIALPLRLGSRPQPQKIAMLGLIWIFLYPALAFGISRYVKATVLPQLESTLTTQNNGEPPVLTKVIIAAEPFAPLNWKILAEDKTHVYVVGYSFLGQGKELEIAKFQRPTPAFWEKLSTKSELMNAYTRFIETPAIEEIQKLTLTPSGRKERIVAILDLRYKSTVPKVLAAFGRKPSMFNFALLLDENDNPLAYQYFRGDLNDCQVWQYFNTESK